MHEINGCRLYYAGESIPVSSESLEHVLLAQEKSFYNGNVAFKLIVMCLCADDKKTLSKNIINTRLTLSNLTRNVHFVPEADFIAAVETVKRPEILKGRISMITNSVELIKFQQTFMTKLGQFCKFSSDNDIIPDVWVFPNFFEFLEPETDKLLDKPVATISSFFSKSIVEQVFTISIEQIPSLAVLSKQLSNITQLKVNDSINFLISERNFFSEISQQETNTVASSFFLQLVGKSIIIAFSEKSYFNFRNNVQKDSSGSFKSFNKTNECKMYVLGVGDLVVLPPNTYYSRLIPDDTVISKCLHFTMTWQHVTTMLYKELRGFDPHFKQYCFEELKINIYNDDFASINKKRKLEEMEDPTEQSLISVQLGEIKASIVEILGLLNKTGKVN